MPDEQTDRWPHFKIVTYSAPTGIPNGWDAELLAKGAPDGISAEAMKELILLEDPDSGPLVSFGSFGWQGYLCLDPRTKQVVSIHYGTTRPGQTQPKVLGPAGLVNASLDQFIASVRVVTDRFPYDSWRPDEEPMFSDLSEEFAYEDKLADEWDTACHEMIELLREIDPKAVEDPDSFWLGLMADIQMGDFSTEGILRPHDR